MATGLAKVGSAAGIMALFLLQGRHWLAGPLAGPVYQQIAAIAFLVAAGATIYGISLHLLGLDELDEIVTKVRSRLGR